MYKNNTFQQLKVIKNYISRYLSLCLSIETEMCVFLLFLLLLKVHRGMLWRFCSYIIYYIYVCTNEGKKKKKIYIRLGRIKREKKITHSRLMGKKCVHFTVMMFDRNRWSANIKLIHLIFFPSPHHIRAIGNVNQFNV